MKHYLAQLEKQRLGVRPGAAVPATGARRIPKALRRLVWERDGGRCTFVSADGHQCGETMRVEVEHITPVALGGEPTAENLRLLCSAHNQHEARRVLGSERVGRRREIAQRERAKSKLAAQASRERQQARDRAAAEEASAQAKARDAAKQARHDDVYAALRGLRSSAAEACRGAGIADAMPDDASTEACLRVALADLARPLLMRGERMVRCTT
jgi:5-methylcytosine-specific restriction endonuclease McrA